MRYWKRPVDGIVFAMADPDHVKRLLAEGWAEVSGPDGAEAVPPPAGGPPLICPHCGLPYRTTAVSLAPAPSPPPPQVPVPVPVSVAAGHATGAGDTPDVALPDEAEVAAFNAAREQRRRGRP